ncbi:MULTISPECIES: orotate phosphoribosyltransferase [Anaerotruncus]|uniref:orotate phosphoribosyltransferase n=1 Tax=Anaerotruncus TaxID=244127 RepID=UPI00082C12D0|nr:MULTISPECIES: orotate phosphoribosyltransferase [Anaerotruncus]
MTGSSVILRSTNNPALEISAVPGHFVKRHCHVNYYIDVTNMQHDHMMAREAGIALAEIYVYDRPVDTILCMDGSEVIAAFLAQRLSKNEMLSMNRMKDIHIVTPESDPNGQMIFRDNLQPKVNGHNLLLLITTVTTGRTIRRLVECAKYYGGNIIGVAAIFSSIDEIDGIPVQHLFSAADLPDFAVFSHSECPACRDKVPIDGLANSFGISRVN